MLSQLATPLSPSFAKYAAPHEGRGAPSRRMEWSIATGLGRSRIALRRAPQVGIQPDCHCAAILGFRPVLPGTGASPTTR
jgi:hypothetical protein